MIAIDLGSNTLRIIQLECQTKKRLFDYEKIVRTAASLHESGQISNEATLRIISAIKEAQSRIDFSADRVAAVATAAFRMASNQKEVLGRIYEETGVLFEVIDAAKEAALSSLAVEARLWQIFGRIDPFLLVDIGGGSTEIVFKWPSALVSESFELGIVTAAERYGKALARYLDDLLKPLKEFLMRYYLDFGKPKQFVATGGTPTTIAAVKLGMSYSKYDPNIINGYRLAPSDLDYVLKQLLSLKEEKREELVGVGRGDLIIAGILIFGGIFAMSGFEECIVIDDGLREGLALAKCQEQDNF